jgi:hypothetical protein
MYNMSLNLDCCTPEEHAVIFLNGILYYIARFYMFHIPASPKSSMGLVCLYTDVLFPFRPCSEVM